MVEINQFEKLTNRIFLISIGLIAISWFFIYCTDLLEKYFSLAIFIGILYILGLNGFFITVILLVVLGMIEYANSKNEEGDYTDTDEITDEMINEEFNDDLPNDQIEHYNS